MIFQETPLKGAFVIEPERLEDDRGFFARSSCLREFEIRGLEHNWVQCSISFNINKGTLRGMHYQLPPHSEVKLVRCTMGAILDVIIDLRPRSETYKHWFSIELSAENRRLLYIPKEFAHGFLTMCDGAEVFYQISEFYVADSTDGIRWDDAAFSIRWPEKPRHLSVKDQQYLPFRR